MADTAEDIRRASEHASIRHRGSQLAQNVWRNVRDIRRCPNANSLDRPLLNRIAVVVGAGPSLDKNIGVLKEHQDRVAILCVNTAARALERAGIRPNAVVAIETMPLPGHIPDGWPVLTSLTSAQPFWEQASWWTVEGSCGIYRLCRILGVQPGNLGVSATTTALAQAIQWGAREVLLCGVDLATPGGQTYATGAAWDVQSRIEETEEYGTRVFLDNPPERDAVFAASNLKAPNAMRSAPIPVEAWDGGETVTVSEFYTQLDWISRRASHCRTPIINCTEGGARIPGTGKEPLATALARSYDSRRPVSIPTDGYIPSEDVVDAAIRDVKGQCVEAYLWARRYITGQVLPCPPIPDIPNVYEVAFPALLGVNDRVIAAFNMPGKPPDAAVMGAYKRAIAGAGSILLSYLEGHPWGETGASNGQAKQPTATVDSPDAQVAGA